MLEDIANYVITEDTTQLDPELENNFNVTIVLESENLTHRFNQIFLRGFYFGVHPSYYRGFYNRLICK